MGNDGELKFGTKLDSSGLIKELNGLGSKAKRALGSITKGVFAIGGALTAVTGIALNFKGELEQNLGGSEAVFGKYAKGLQEKAETAFKNMGLSASDYLATANKMGALFKGAGFEQEEAANKASEAMQRAADIASIMGIDVSVAMESIAGAAKGNFTMMDNLGVAMNDTTLNAYALEKGIGKTTKQMTNQEKVALAMEMFLDRTSYAAGNYAKENETLAGSLTTAKAALKNYLAGTGDVDDVVDSLTNAAKVIMKNVKELLPKLVKGLGKGIRQILPLVPDMLRELIPAVASVIGDLIATVAEMAPDIIIALAEGIGDSVPVLKPFTDILKVLAENLDVIAPAIIPVVAAIAAYEAATSLAAAAQTALNLAMSLSPLGLAAAAVAVVAGGVTALALAAQNSQNSYESMGKEIEATTDKVASSMQKVNETDVKIEQWNELKDSLNDTSLSSEELEDRQAKLKDVEQWFIDNYGEYISAEEQKNGIRDDTIKKISNQADLLERANKLELANTILKNKDNIPELEKETEALKQQNKELDELRTGIAYERDEVKLLAAEWENQILQLENGNITQDEFDENIRKIKNSLAEMGRESNSFDAVSANIKKADDQISSLDSIINENVDTIAQNEQTILAFTKAVQMYVDFDVNATYEQKKEEAETFGMQYVDGMVKGIDRNSSEVVKAVNRMSDDAVKAVKKRLDIESPSKVMNKEVGKWLPLGVAEGIEENSESAVKAFDTMLEKLEYQRKFDIINDDEYYTELEKLRDEHFKEGTKEWLEYTLEIYEYQQEEAEKELKLIEERKDKIRDLYSDIAEYAEDSMEKVVKSQEELENKLKGFGSLSNTVTIAGAGENGEDITYQKPADIKAYTATLNEYMDGLETIKGRLSSLTPERASAFMAELSDMSIEDGTSLMNSLNRLNDADLNEYLAAWNEFQDASEQRSASYYKDDFQKSIDDSIGYMKGKLTEAGLTIPESFFDCGKTSGEEYGKGFIGEIDKIMQTAYGMISNFAASLSFPALATAGAGGTYTSYTNYFNVGTTKDTTDEQITAWTNLTEAERMRGS